MAKALEDREMGGPWFAVSHELNDDGIKSDGELAVGDLVTLQADGVTIVARLSAAAGRVYSRPLSHSARHP